LGCGKTEILGGVKEKMGVRDENAWGGRGLQCPGKGQVVVKKKGRGTTITQNTQTNTKRRGR